MGERYREWSAAFRFGRRRRSAPPLVHFTGILHPPDEKAAGRQALDIFTGEEEQQFTLHDAETLTYTTDPD